MVRTPSQFARNTLDRICDLANKIIERLSGGHASARDIAMAEKIANYTQQLTLSAPGAYSRLLAQHRFTILTQCEPANFNADLLRNALDAYAIHSGWDEASPQDIVEHFIESAGHLTPNDIANLRAAKPRLTEAAQAPPPHPSGGGSNLAPPEGNPYRLPAGPDETTRPDRPGPPEEQARPKSPTVEETPRVQGTLTEAQANDISLTLQSILRPFEINALRAYLNSEFGPVAVSVEEIIGLIGSETTVAKVKKRLDILGISSNATLPRDKWVDLLGARGGGPSGGPPGGAPPVGGPPSGGGGAPPPAGPAGPPPAAARHADPAPATTGDPASTSSPTGGGTEPVNGQQQFQQPQQQPQARHGGGNDDDTAAKPGNRPAAGAATATGSLNPELFTKLGEFAQKAEAAADTFVANRQNSSREAQRDAWTKVVKAQADLMFAIRQLEQAVREGTVSADAARPHLENSKNVLKQIIDKLNQPEETPAPAETPARAAPPGGGRLVPWRRALRLIQWLRNFVAQRANRLKFETALRERLAQTSGKMAQAGYFFEYIIKPAAIEAFGPDQAAILVAELKGQFANPTGDANDPPVTSDLQPQEIDLLQLDFVMRQLFTAADVAAILLPRVNPEAASQLVHVFKIAAPTPPRVMTIGAIGEIIRTMENEPGMPREWQGLSDLLSPQRIGVSSGQEISIDELASLLSQGTQPPQPPSGNPPPGAPPAGGPGGTTTPAGGSSPGGAAAHAGAARTGTPPRSGSGGSGGAGNGGSGGGGGGLGAVGVGGGDAGAPPPPSGGGGGSGDGSGRGGGGRRGGRAAQDNPPEASSNAGPAEEALLLLHPEFREIHALANTAEHAVTRLQNLTEDLLPGMQSADERAWIIANLKSATAG